jgi:Ca2+-binding EF-hand superfamily protein
MKAAGTLPQFGKGFGKGGGTPKGSGTTGNPTPGSTTTPGSDKKGAGTTGEKKFGGPPGDKKSAGPGDKKGGPSDAKSTEDQGDPVERMFKRYDRDGDGLLNQEEIGGTKALKNEWQKWDADKDTKINWDEYRTYMKSREQQAQEKKDSRPEKSGDSAKPASSGGVDVIVINEYIRPENWRAGKLPDNLPDWFKEYDINKDGQVAHHEWLKKSTDPISKFFGMDKNDDGLLTPDEVIRSIREASAAASGKTTLASAKTEDTKTERKGKGKGKGGK